MNIESLALPWPVIGLWRPRRPWAIASITRVIRRAATELDRLDPAWFTRVNTDTIKMSSIYDCVLGQAFDHCSGGYASGFGYATRQWPHLFVEAKGSFRFAFSSGASAWTREIRWRLRCAESQC